MLHTQQRSRDVVSPSNAGLPHNRDPTFDRGCGYNFSTETAVYEKASKQLNIWRQRENILIMELELDILKKNKTTTNKQN